MLLMTAVSFRSYLGKYIEPRNCKGTEQCFLYRMNCFGWNCLIINVVEFFLSESNLDVNVTLNVITLCINKNHCLHLANDFCTSPFGP
ncbi:hypothetical protein ES288_A06G056200v1 [Gossypium darwinii]|uniref:Uncharacterized protein n=1 Tax=Gossypium darwinii TaxID=34276 RepID=A0A5D2G294_GOSDA|nr:hypothetical protein ES288_A06G056200v1 [Gossypium darwinii]